MDVAGAGITGCHMMSSCFPLRSNFPARHLVVWAVVIWGRVLSGDPMSVRPEEMRVEI